MLLPFVGLLWIPFDNQAEPALFGFPFFYWCQLLWVPISALPCALLAGWAVGFFGGTYVVWTDGLKPLRTIVLGGTNDTLYVGILALSGTRRELRTA